MNPFDKELYYVKLKGNVILTNLTKEEVANMQPPLRVYRDEIVRVERKIVTDDDGTYIVSTVYDENNDEINVLERPLDVQLDTPVNIPLGTFYTGLNSNESIE